ncbi:prepilin-type N-terminal cleavage/methylation domain-containing protein [Candidatus Roizmanbacteria bacterium]|nr:prepilin-type N-terminal cleavage/methylation domain-containing protein [Candidatus Roizmanbacteria bacterium]
MDKNNLAFTLIELIVTLSIILIFVTLTLPNFNIYSQQLKLKNDAQKFVDIFELAKKKAITSDLYDQSCSQFNGYRITLDANSYILKFGCAGVYQNIQTYNFDPNNTSITGVGDFDFPPLGLNINLSISAIRFKNTAINQCIDISVSRIGIININNSLVSC